MAIGAAHKDYHSVSTVINTEQYPTVAEFLGGS